MQLLLELTPSGPGLVGCVVGAVVTWLVSWLLRPLAPRLNLLDFPKGRKDHAHPTPIVGGIAMLCGVLAASMVMLPTLLPTFHAFLAGAILLTVVGLVDDRYDLRWYWRIGAQVIAALLMVYWGGVRVDQLGSAFGVTHLPLGALGVPFTVFATVGLINAINMVDGADGLAGALVLTALVLLFGAGMYSGNMMMADSTLMLAGVVSAFLWFNVRFPWRPQAKIFMGNAGSALLGFTIAWVAFRLTQTPGHPISPVFALWALAVPVADTLVLMVRRIRAGHSPFHADRNHVHHFMRDAGYGPSRTTGMLAVFTATSAVVVGQAMRMDVPTPLLLALFGVLVVGWYWISADRARAISFFRVVYPEWLFGPLTRAQARAYPEHAASRGNLPERRKDNGGPDGPHARHILP